MAQAANDQQVLSGYWVRMDQLSKPEWADFYRRVRMALLRCPAPQLRNLPDSRENYICEFFAEKLFFKAQRIAATGNQTISGGALCGFFRNYLTDVLHGYQRMPLLGDSEAEPGMPIDLANPEEAIKVFLNQIGGHEVLVRSVKDFRAHLEDWALLMLSGHFCADDDKAIPMAALCRGIPAYHYKAQGLGITVKKHTADFRGYERTRIGQWINAMGVDIAPENYAVIRFLLGALCVEAAVIGEGTP